MSCSRSMVLPCSLPWSLRLSNDSSINDTCTNIAYLTLRIVSLEATFLILEHICSRATILPCGNIPLFPCMQPTPCPCNVSACSRLVKLMKYPVCVNNLFFPMNPTSAITWSSTLCESNRTNLSLSPFLACVSYWLRLKYMHVPVVPW